MRGAHHSDPLDGVVGVSASGLAEHYPHYETAGVVAYHPVDEVLGFLFLTSYPTPEVFIHPPLSAGIIEFANE